MKNDIGLIGKGNNRCLRTGVAIYLSELLETKDCFLHTKTSFTHFGILGQKM